MDKPEKDNRPAGLRNSTVRVTTQYLRQRGKVGMTLTRTELEHLSRLLKAGKIMLNDTQDVSKNLRQAMSKLGVDTKGL